MLQHDKGGVRAPKQSSAKVVNNVGSGSRPGKSKHPIKTSAPADPHGLGGRKTKNALS